MGWGRHTLEPLERRASLDSLAALTIMLRLHHEQGNLLAVSDYAQVIFRVLLMLGQMFEDRAIAEQIFKIYVSRVFSLVVLPGKRIALENYDYLTRFRLLSLLADEVRAQSGLKNVKKLMLSAAFMHPIWPTLNTVQLITVGCVTLAQHVSAHGPLGLFGIRLCGRRHALSSG